MLKKSFTILSIIFYLSLALKSFIPQLAYKINLEYIIKYLCEQKDETENLCMGHCYLNKKIKEETEKEEKAPSGLVTKNFEIHYALLNFNWYSAKSSCNNKIIFGDLQLTLLLNPQKPIVPPP